MSTHYARHGASVRAARRKRYRTDPEHRRQVSARGQARRAYPDPQPCEQCGAERADRHHDDYARPLEIRWLCRSCHVRHHAEELGSWGSGLRG